MSDDQRCEILQKELCEIINEIKNEHSLRRLKATATVLADNEKSNITN